MSEHTTESPTKAVRRRRSSMLPCDDIIPDLPENDPADAVLVDAWDLYHTALDIARHGVVKQDSGWITLAAVGLRHVFEWMSYDPDVGRLGVKPDKTEVEDWVRTHWSGFTKLNAIANGSKHLKLLRRSGRPTAKFERHERIELCTSIFDLVNGAGTSQRTTVTLTKDDGDAETIDIQEILESGFDFAYTVFETYFPEKLARRPLSTTSSE